MTISHYSDLLNVCGHYIKQPMLLWLAECYTMLECHPISFWVKGLTVCNVSAYRQEVYTAASTVMHNYTNTAFLSYTILLYSLDPRPSDL